MMTVLETIGVFAFAISGALVAVRNHFDLVGILILAVITAIGGGILRDVMIGDIPPTALTAWPYYAAPLAAAAAVFVFSPMFERLGRMMLVLDAAGVGMFCVTGTVKALDYGMGVVPAAALGVTTGLGGGLLRDIVARDTPVLVRPDSELYAIPAMAGALAVAVLWEVEAYAPAWGAAIAVAVITVRLLALQRGWRAPVALSSRPDRTTRRP